MSGNAFSEENNKIHCIYNLLISGESPCPDSDKDTICDSEDNCLFTVNPSQGDLNGDGIGDACDPDGKMNALALIEI